MSDGSLLKIYRKIDENSSGNIDISEFKEFLRGNEFWRKGRAQAGVRTDFVPGLPHVMRLSRLRQALVSYQDYHMLCCGSLFAAGAAKDAEVSQRHDVAAAARAMEGLGTPEWCNSLVQAVERHGERLCKGSADTTTTPRGVPLSHSPSYAGSTPQATRTTDNGLLAHARSQRSMSLLTPWAQGSRLDVQSVEELMSPSSRQHVSRQTSNVGSPRTVAMTPRPPTHGPSGTTTILGRFLPPILERHFLRVQTVSADSHCGAPLRLPLPPAARMF